MTRLNLDDLHVYAWETASLTTTRLLALEAEIGALFDWSEGVSIVTCQRYEIVTLGPARLMAPSCYRGLEAISHLSRLAAGLDSLVLGETEILGQVRSAFSAAPPELRRLIAPAIASARTLRSERAFGQHAGYALDIALDYAAFEAEGTLLVVGGGPMGRRVAARAMALGFQVTLVARRPPPLPQGIQYRPFSALPTLPTTDVVVTCLGRTAPQMGPSDLPLINRLAVDLGTPRNLKDDFSVPVISLAALIAARKDGGLESGERLSLDQRLMELLATRLAMDVPDSPLGTLREEVERIRQRELIRTLRLHPELSPEKLDTITRTLVNQIFHRPSRRLRRSGDIELATALAGLFGPPAEANDGN